MKDWQDGQNGQDGQILPQKNESPHRKRILEKLPKIKGRIYPILPFYPSTNFS